MRHTVFLYDEPKNTVMQRGLAVAKRNDIESDSSNVDQNIGSFGDGLN